MNPTPMTQRQAAYTATAKARAKGELVKPDHCERCGKTTTYVYAHHPDYSKPLEVQWLCGSCHKQTHIEAGEVQHWRTGKAVVALTAEQRRDREAALWAKTKSIRVKHRRYGWSVWPRGRNWLSKREAIKMARTMAEQHGVPVIRVINADGEIGRVIIMRKKNGNKKAGK